MPQQIKLAVNGLGRLGRQVFRALQERPDEGFELAVVRDCMPIELLVHLLSIDSTHGAAPFSIEAIDSETLLVAGTQQIAYQRVPGHADYREWPEVDVVLDCTGSFMKFAAYRERRWKGAKRIVISAPAEAIADQVIVLGANETTLDSRSRLLSAGSCTTHALAVVLAPLLQHLSIESVAVTELHGFTHDQKLLDGAHDDWRRARGATQSMIPTRTAGIGTTEVVLPALVNRVMGYSMRVPITNGAAIDLTIQCHQHAADIELSEVIEWYQQAAKDWNQHYGRPLLDLEWRPLVSSDYVNRSESAIIDVERLQKQGTILRLLAWFDNEVGYAHRLLDLVKIL